MSVKYQFRLLCLMSFPSPHFRAQRPNLRHKAACAQEARGVLEGTEEMIHDLRKLAVIAGG